MPDFDLQRYRLTEAEHHRIFTERIVPRRFADLTAQQNRVVVFVGGQPGAGKTATTKRVLNRLRTRGTPAHVCGDHYKPHHPDYDRLLVTDELAAAAYARLDVRAWHAKAENHAREARADTVIETALTGPGGFSEPAAAFRAAGYRIEVIALAVPEAWSRLGILTRYAAQVDQHGHGRLVEPANHDNCYHGMADTLAGIDTDRTADVLAIERRGNQTRYLNALTPDSTWAEPPAAAATLTAERSRRWTQTEARAFATELARLRDRDDPALRAAADTVARLAAPYLPPGVRAATHIGRVTGARPPVAEQPAALHPDPLPRRTPTPPVPPDLREPPARGLRL
ncbi:MAG: zeta toxin family protein [Sporichthyaceae bacterium]